MYEWFECKVRYEKTMDNGLQKKVIEPYLVDAFSFTEAEARIMEEMKPFIRGEFELADIKKLKIAELIESNKPEDDRWYKAKLNFIVIDERSGKEKKTSNQVLVKANNIRAALVNIDEGMKGTLDYVVSAIVETPIMDVYHYKQTDQPAG